LERCLLTNLESSSTFIDICTNVTSFGWYIYLYWMRCRSLTLYHFFRADLVLVPVLWIVIVRICSFLSPRYNLSYFYNTRNYESWFTSWNKKKKRTHALT
jgi:hypothetical protein